MAARHGAVRFRAWAVLLPFALLGGCDSFSLTELLVLPGTGESDRLSILAAATTVPRNGDPVALTVTGGTPDYNFSVVADDLYPGTDTESLGGVFNLTYDPGLAIGRMEIIVTDAEGDSARVYINVVPPAPGLNVVRQGPSDVRITWTYSETGVIDEFRIQKSVDGGPFNILNVFDSATTETIDNSAPTNGSVYSYRIYAVSGAYDSLPTEGAVGP